MIPQAEQLIAEWEARFAPYEPHPASRPDPERLLAAWEAYCGRMGHHYPFFHPHYAGQMLKPPHPVAAAGYLAAMLINPNNHALDGGPGTSALEQEVVAELAAMFGLPEPNLGHLTSSGTIANLEALWVARELHPDKGILHSAQAHYTHARMCQVLRMESRAVPASPDGCIDLDAVESELATGDIGTIVLTPGTTGLGAVDQIHEALQLRERYGVRIHVDAAYGGFFTLLAQADEPLVTPEPFARDRRSATPSSSTPTSTASSPTAAARCSSPTRASAASTSTTRPTRTSPPSELHLGEISLECSRAGAAAAALWLTLRVFPLVPDDGLGAILAAGRRAALDWAERLSHSDVLCPHVEPELDIVTYFPRAEALTSVDAASAALLNRGMSAREDPVFLSTLWREASAMHGLHPGLQLDADGARVLRSVLMKPEHELAVADLHARVEELAR